MKRTPTADQINVAIAEHLGWHAENSQNKFSALIFNPQGNSAKRWVKNTGGEWVDMWINGAHFPSYCTDLNACHEMEKHIHRSQMQAYCHYINSTVQGTMDVSTNMMLYFSHVHATARQRAEAFLRAVGKWKE
jgi:hypothetical protein